MAGRKSAADQHRIKLATRTRHRGHSVFFIGQRVTLLPPAIRTQCEHAYVFRQNSRREIMHLCEEFGDDARSIGELQRGECLYLSTYSHPVRINVFNDVQ